MKEFSVENPVVIYGGNGFVGSKIAEHIASKGLRCLCISRSGTAPVHLQQHSYDWLRRVEWLRGDASNADGRILRNARVVISTVGSPPLPTFSESAFNQQVFNNGTANVLLIEAAKKAGVKRIVLVSAQVPALLQRQGFAYYVGKQQALDAARQFARLSMTHSGAVLTPSVIYGTRHTANGTAIPLWWVMAPVAKLQRAMPLWLARFLPEPMVSVDKVAAAAAAMAVDKELETGEISVLRNQQLAHWC